MAKEKKHKWTAEEVIDLLRQRYDKPGNGRNNRYVFIEQVAPATGFSHRSTWIDAMVINMWPSEGLHREAFEVKVSRSDFLNEINDPHKNTWFKANNHKFWYVTAPGVIKTEDEVPEGCGWLLAQKGRLVVKKQATHRDIDDRIDNEFFCAIARAMEKEQDAAQRRMRQDVLAEPDIAHALASAKTLQAWLLKQGVVPSNRRYQSYAWESEGELHDLLQRALAGDGEAKLADVLDARLRHFRDKILTLLLELTPYAADLLTDVSDIGRYISGYMETEASFDILTDLMQKPGRFASDREKRERKARLKYVRRLLDLGRQADMMEDQETGEDA